MIYGSSNHPVEIKKIRCKVWTLKEEIAATLRDKLEQGLSHKEAQKYIEGLYHGLIRLPASIEQELSGAAPSGEDIVETDALDDSEDAMAAALAEAENEESSESEDANDETNSEDQNAEENSNTEPEIISEVESVNNVLFLKRHRPNLSGEIIGDVVTFLSDVNMSMISCFSSRNFLFGQTIVLEFLVPQRFFVTAEVLECRNYNMESRIISGQRPKYRLHAKFTFPREAERTLLRRFLRSVEPEVPIESPKQKPKQDDDDGLGDLEDLGL